MKTVTIVKQPNNLYTVTTVETTIEKDVPITLDSPPKPDPTSPQPTPQPIPTSPTLWRMASNFSALSLGATARQDTGITEAFSATKVAMSPDGRKCAEMGITAGISGSGQWGGIISHPTNLVEGNEVIFKVSSYFPVGFDFTATPRLKFLRVHTGSGVNINEGYLDLYILPQGGFSHDSEVAGVYTSNGGGLPLGKPIVTGVWETYEVHVKFSSTPGVGFYKVRQNGVLIYENLTHKTLRSAQSYSDRSHIFTYWNHVAPKTQHMYIDNVSVTAR